MKKRLRSSVVCVHQKTLLVFKGVDPSTQTEYWFLPGGKIEENEEPWACAEREALEETGYRIQVLPETEHRRDYLFTWDNTEYECTTFFYKGVLAETFHPPRPIQDVDYNQGAYWLPLADLDLAFAYSSEIREAVQTLIR